MNNIQNVYGSQLDLVCPSSNFIKMSSNDNNLVPTYRSLPSTINYKKQYNQK